MLGIRALFLGTLGVCLILMLAGGVAVQYSWLQPAQNRHVLSEQESEVDSFLRMLKVQQDGLGMMATDYSQREEVEIFLRQGQEGYFSRILTPDLFETLQIDGFAVLDNRQRSLMSFYVNGNLTHIRHQAFDELLENLPLANEKEPARHFVARFHNIPYLIIPRVITDSYQHRLGWLVIARAIDESLLDSIRTATRVNFHRNSAAETGDLPWADINQPLSSPQAQRTLCISDITPRVLCLDFEHASPPPPLLDANMLLLFLLTMLVPGGITMVLLNGLLKPLLHTIAVIHRSSEEGEVQPVLQTGRLRVREVQKLQDAYNHLVNKVNLQREKLEALSTTDSLTGIANRLAFDRAFENSWNRIRRRHYSIALIMIDIDHFKLYNDTYGHQQGDQALARVAGALQSLAQRTDEIVARYGGEEFAMIVYCPDRQSLNQLQQRLHAAIWELHITHSSSPVTHELTISAGVAWIPNTGEWLTNRSRESWLQEADTALYQAKADGRNRTAIRLMQPAPRSVAE